MDKKTYNKTEETYQFQEPEIEKHFSSAAGRSQETPNIFERVNRQSIIAGFIFIFLLFGAYKLLSGVFHTLYKPHVAEKVITPVAKIDPTKQLMTTAVDPVATRLDKLAKGQADVQSSLQALDSEISALQTNVATLSNQLTQVDDEVQSLHTAQETLIQSQLKAVKKTAEKKAAPKAIYYVRAIIPGRVWLTTQEGTTLTLGVGDKLPGYGVLDSINVDQGIVTFSSGSVIGYSPDDR